MLNFALLDLAGKIRCGFVFCWQSSVCFTSPHGDDSFHFFVLCSYLFFIVRFMNYAGCKRKFDISAYVSRVRALVKLATGK